MPDSCPHDVQPPKVCPDCATLPPPKLRGFALMKARGDDISAISRSGGKAAHAAGTAHRYTSEEGREAGRKGGRATHRNRKGAAL